LKRLSDNRDYLKSRCSAYIKGPAEFVFENDLSYLYIEANKVGLAARKESIGNIDLFSLHEMAVYGMKGACAYFHEAEVLRIESKLEINTKKHR